MKKTLPLTLSFVSTLRAPRLQGMREFKALLSTAKPFLLRFLTSKRYRPGVIFGKEGEIGVTIHLVGEQKIRSLNSSHRNKSRITDVLSFPIHEQFPLGKIQGPHDLGDVVIAHSVATKQAKKLKVSVGQELFHLFLHGFLHLCGYDHEISVEEERIMMELEEKLSQNIYTSHYGKKGRYER